MSKCVAVEYTVFGEEKEKCGCQFCPGHKTSPLIKIHRCSYLPEPGTELCPRHAAMKSYGIEVILPPNYREVK